ncbi:hypothetical protein ACVGV7_00010, partial [Enterobacter intestinihominis]
PPPPRFFNNTATTVIYTYCVWAAGSFFFNTQPFDPLVVLSSFYRIGVMLLVFGSRPLGGFIRQRAQERRK